MSNQNCENIKNSDSCDSCNSCDSCDYCDSCDSCDYCYSCYSCYSCNSCDGLRMSERMIFCLGEGKYESKGAGFQKNIQIFNKEVSKEVFDNTWKLLKAKDFKLPIAKWIEYKDLEESDKTTTSKQLNGLLKTLSYKDAWQEMWKELSSDDKKFFGTLPNFDSKIFEKITGIEYKIEDDATEQAIELLKKNGYKIIKN